MIRKIFVVLGTFGAVLGIILVGVAIISFTGSMRPKIEKSEPEKTQATVFVEIAEPEDVNLSVIAQGEVSPETEIALSAQVSGKIEAVSKNFNDGGVIHKGEQLVKIEDADYRVALARAQAGLAQAEQALKVAEVEADLAAKDAHDIGAEDGQLSPLALRMPQLQQARASYQAAKADVANAELNLSRTVVRAPFNGRIRKKIADIGQFIGPGAQLAQIFSTDVALIRVPLTDEDFTRLGLPLAYTADSSPLPAPKVLLSAIMGGRVLNWQGRVVRTDASIDPTTRQISAIIEVDDPYGEGADNGFPLAMGLFVTAEILGQEIKNAFVLPRIAVQSDNSVYIVDDENILRKQTVIIAASIPQGIVITEGIEPGQKIVVSRLGSAKVGETVIPLAPGETLPPPTSPEQEVDQPDDGAAAETDSPTDAGTSGGGDASSGGAAQ
jgi:RND family efflux transporter MFP subunit